MEKRIRARYHEGILDAVGERYGIAEGAIRPLDAFESFIFEFEKPGASGLSERLILRLSHSLRRTPELIYGEVDWINYLARGGARVAPAVPSPAGNLVETVEDGQGGQFFATAFVKAGGDQPWNVGWTPGLFEAYGRLIGRMHALTKDYVPGRPEWRRPEWDDPIFMYVDPYMPNGEEPARERYAEALTHVRSLPRGRDSYGLTHQDAHGANMHVDAAGRLILFDFDDCGYHYFANDIAMVLFYMAMGKRNNAEFAEHFMGHFMSGYREENALEGWWLAELPWFMKLREIELYAVIHRDFDFPSGHVSQIDDAWCRAFMAGRKAAIERGDPFLDMDFGALAD